MLKCLELSCFYALPCFFWKHFFFRKGTLFGTTKPKVVTERIEWATQLSRLFSWDFHHNLEKPELLYWFFRNLPPSMNRDLWRISLPRLCTTPRSTPTPWTPRIPTLLLPCSRSFSSFSRREKNLCKKVILICAHVLFAYLSGPCLLSLNFAYLISKLKTFPIRFISFATDKFCKSVTLPMFGNLRCFGI